MLIIWSWYREYIINCLTLFLSLLEEEDSCLSHAQCRLIFRWTEMFGTYFFLGLTCSPSVPGCCSSLTGRPPAVLRPCPSCQVRFPPAQRLNWYLKSSGRALYSTAGRQKVKLEAAAIQKERFGIHLDIHSILLTCVFTSPFRKTQTTEMYSLTSALWEIQCLHSSKMLWLQVSSRTVFVIRGFGG